MELTIGPPLAVAGLLLVWSIKRIHMTEPGEPRRLLDVAALTIGIGILVVAVWFIMTLYIGLNGGSF